MSMSKNPETFEKLFVKNGLKGRKKPNYLDEFERKSSEIVLQNLRLINARDKRINGDILLLPYPSLLSALCSNLNPTFQATVSRGLAASGYRRRRRSPPAPLPRRPPHPLPHPSTTRGSPPVRRFWRPSQRHLLPNPLPPPCLLRDTPLPLKSGSKRKKTAKCRRRRFKNCRRRCPP